MKRPQMIWAVAVAVLGMRLAAFAEEAYIASTTKGPVYSIDTGYKIGPTTGVYADFEFIARTADVFPANTYQQFVFEAGGGGAARFYINGTTGNGALAWNFTKEYVWSSTGVTMVPGTRYQMSVDAFTRSAWLDVAGVRSYTANFAANTTVPNYTETIKLFSGTGGGGNGALMKLYRFTITESGETVHDYVPALKGGMAGMYDLTTGEFLYDIRSASQAFEYGGDILELEDDAYIESDGTSFMNSRFVMNPGAKVEMDYALVGANATQRRLFGADVSGATFFSAYYINGSGNMSFGIGDAFVPWSTGIVTNFYRHRAVLDVANIHAYYITRFHTNWTGNASVAYGICATNISKTAAHPMGLFGDCSAATGLTSANRATVKVYGVKCWQNGELVHDYVPHVKGGVAGFRDLVDGAFIMGEVASAFTAGGNITREADDGYISSTGNNYNTGYRYIDTGYIASANTRVELDYALADNYPAGDYVDNQDWFLFEAVGSLRIDAYLNKQGMGWSGVDKNWHNFNMPLQTAQKDVRRTTIVDNTGWAAILTAGFTNRYYTATPASATYNSKTLRLAGPTSGNGYAPLKIYGLKIYESGSLVRSYVPCVKDGAAALKETFTDTYVFSEVNRPFFTAGGNITDYGNSDAYIESDGTQGINTGWLMNGSESRIEADFAFTDTYRVNGNYQQRVFGTDTTGDLVYALYINGNGQFMYGFGNTFINTHGPGAAADSKRHTAIIDGYHDRLYFITGGVTNNSYDISADAHDHSTTVPMGIFATPNQAAATTWRNGAKMKLFSLRVYECDGLVHEYLPYRKGSTFGLYDTVDKVVKTDARNSATPFKIGGMGVDGAERWLVEPSGGKLTVNDGTKILSANASGAQSYKWTKNGEAITDGADGDLAVSWTRGGKTDTYAVTPVYSIYGNEVEGAPVSVMVENVPIATTVVIR